MPVLEKNIRTKSKSSESRSNPSKKGDNLLKQGALRRKRKVPQKEGRRFRFWIAKVGHWIKMSFLVCFYGVIFYFLEIYGESIIGYTLGQEQFLIHQIEIDNNVLMNDSEVLKLIKVQSHENIVQCDIGRIQDILERDHRIERASVRRRFPGTLSIHLEERVPLFRLRIGGELVDRQGRELPLNLPIRTFEHLPVLGGFSLTTFGEISEEDQARFQSVIQLWEEFERAFMKDGLHVESILFDKSWIDLVFQEGMKVRFPLDDFKASLAKLKKVLKDLKRKKKKASSIDLQFKDVVVKI